MKWLTSGRDMPISIFILCHFAHQLLRTLPWLVFHDLRLIWILIFSPKMQLFLFLSFCPFSPQLLSALPWLVFHHIKLICIPIFSLKILYKTVYKVVIIYYFSKSHHYYTTWQITSYSGAEIQRNGYKCIQSLHSKFEPHRIMKEATIKWHKDYIQKTS